MSKSRVNINLIKPGNMDAKSHQLLQELIDSDPLLARSKLLKAGDYMIAPAGSSRSIIIRLASDVICAGDVDPSNPSIQNNKIHHLLLLPQYAGKYFPQGMNVFSDVNDSGETKFYCALLTSAVGVRKNDYGNIVCDVYGNKIFGKGAFGAVREIIGSLKYRYHTSKELVFEPSSGRRLVKEMRCGSTDLVKFSNQVTHEAEMLNAAPHTGARSTLYGTSVTGEQVALISMLRFPGSELHNFISDDDQLLHFRLGNVSDSVSQAWLRTQSKTKMSPLTIDDRFQISIELLKQLRHQVHDNGLIHRDIKPDNIMITRENGVWKVNIIDFNLARFAAHDDKKRCGAPHYVAREVLDAELDESSDLFSMGLVIALLWRDEEQRELLKMLDGKKMFQHRGRVDWDIDLGMFKGLDGLSGEIKLSLSLLLTYILGHKKQRPSLEECLAQFEDIYLSYQLSLSLSSNAHEVVEGCEMANLVQAKINKNAGKSVNHLSVCKLRDDLIKIIDKVADNQHAVQVFIKAVNVKCFEGLKMKDQMKNKIKDVTDNFLAAYQQTEELLAQLREIYANIGEQGSLTNELRQRVTVLSEQIHEVAMFAEKIAKTPLDIDSIELQTQHLLKKNGKIERAMLYFDELKPAQEQQSRLQVCQ